MQGHVVREEKGRQGAAVAVTSLAVNTSLFKPSLQGRTYREGVPHGHPLVRGSWFNSTLNKELSSSTPRDNVVASMVRVNAHAGGHVDPPLP